jgi:hypothetical protein
MDYVDPLRFKRIWKENKINPEDMLWLIHNRPWAILRVTTSTNKHFEVTAKAFDMITTHHFTSPGDPDERVVFLELVGRAPDDGDINTFFAIDDPWCGLRRDGWFYFQLMHWRKLQPPV